MLVVSCLTLHRERYGDSTTLTDIPASSDSIINGSSKADSNDYAEDSLSLSSSFAPVEESDQHYDGTIVRANCK